MFCLNENCRKNSYNGQNPIYNSDGQPRFLYKKKNIGTEYFLKFFVHNFRSRKNSVSNPNTPQSEIQTRYQTKQPNFYKTRFLHIAPLFIFLKPFQSFSSSIQLNDNKLINIQTSLIILFHDNNPNNDL